MTGLPHVRISVIGAGLIGERHARMVAGHPDCSLAAIIDPDPEKRSLARELGAQWYGTMAEIPDAACDAAIVATPNALHLETGIACLERKWPCLIEKPIADTIANGQALVEAFERAQIPLLIGHHRRYHPFVEQTRSLIGSGDIGQPVFASIIWAVRKPHSYFEQGAWRLDSDGGPLLINLIHEIDLMRCIFGPVDEIQAIVTNLQRGGQVEDTAAILVHFESGLLATVAVTDAALTPWSFEGACGENPNIAETGISSWRIGCTFGAFEFPGLRVWRHAGDGEGDWSKPLTASDVQSHRVTPLFEQVSHFASLVRGKTDKPMVSGRDGVAALQAVMAIQQSARSGRPVKVADVNGQTA
ncbi:MAG: Gfo/Idh/MocA family oxidoreductase [Hyphomicrobiales bacterium]|nr:Gfo/Idh/MocA family oxidoreductase [Hyphomicrobiales bacterium]MCP4997927.1 Gfo/Idh/MocA family oxidoreductase [Hyphomicrobiales bacterium]